MHRLRCLCYPPSRYLQFRDGPLGDLFGPAPTSVNPPAVATILASPFACPDLPSVLVAPLAPRLRWLRIDERLRPPTDPLGYAASCRIQGRVWLPERLRSSATQVAPPTPAETDRGDEEGSGSDAEGSGSDEDEDQGASAPISTTPASSRIAAGRCGRWFNHGLLVRAGRAEGRTGRG